MPEEDFQRLLQFFKVLADETKPLAHVAHIAIYRPRQVAAA